MESMAIYPKITLTFLNGFLLIIPLLGLRLVLPALLRKETLAQLDYFPPVIGREQIALKVYFLTNTFLIFSPLLAKISTSMPWILIGWAIYALGLIVFGLSVWNFCNTSGVLIRAGIYRFSRNPMYIGYCLIFIGVGFLIGSWFHLAIALIYQSAAHFLILSEERWCRATFGAEFTDYLKKVHRYF